MPPANVPDLTREAAARFARDLGALVDIATGRVLVAVSGGPDSIALLLLTHDAIGDRCVAATVDHGLRAEARDEAMWVASMCAERGIGHATLSGELPNRAGQSANVSARARALRYRLLDEHARAVGADTIATAHHADDQLETMIMRLNRGAGVGGLAGVRTQGDRIVRPLLGWRRAELVDLVASHGIDAIDDPSNIDNRYDRARLRKALAGIDWLDREHWAQSAVALADADDAIAWSVRAIEAQYAEHIPGMVTLSRSDFPREIRRRLIERAVRHVDPTAELRGPALIRALDALDAGGRTMLGNVVCEALANGIWRFCAAPPRRSR